MILTLEKGGMRPLGEKCITVYAFRFIFENTLMIELQEVNI